MKNRLTPAPPAFEHIADNYHRYFAMMPLSSSLSSRRVNPTSKKAMQASLRQKERASAHAATILDLFAQFPIFDEICHCLDIGDIIRLTRTCKCLSTLYRSLLPSQWNVDKHLRRFVDRPLTLRHQMASCDALGRFILST